jgi:hypothetical protein
VSSCAFLNWAPRNEGVLGEWRYSSTHYLTSARDGGEWSASRPGRFTSRERAPGSHWIGGWVGARAVLDTAVVKRNIPTFRRESNPRTPIVQSVAQHYTDWAITALREPRIARFEVFSAVFFQVVCWAVTLFVVGYRRCGGPCCLEIQGLKRRYPTTTLYCVTTQEASTWKYFISLCTLTH